MTGELALSVLHGPGVEGGRVAAFAVTDQQVVAVGGAAERSPLVLASADARRFERRTAPGELALHDVLALGDSLWACGERGQLAVSRDHGAHWQLVETGTAGCLRGLALGSDGAIWVVGDAGYAARILGGRPRLVELGTAARLSSVQPVRDEIVMLGGDGRLVRWQGGQPAGVACGATGALTALAITPKGTWVVVGHGGFVARSPDGTWYSRVDPGAAVGVDLEAIAVLPDGSLVIAGDRGQLLRSTDDARTWRPIANRLGEVHLWSIERFGGGALIGGDGGLIARLAPPEDTTRSERSEVSGAALSGDSDTDAAWGPAAGATSRAACDDELDRTPPARWADLAWRWLDDGVAHRALLARLEHTQGAQLAAIDALRETPQDERAIALPRLAAELSPELEAVLVGSLVRDDALEGAPVGHGDGDGDDGDDGDDDDGDDDDDHDDDEVASPGWDAIDRALAPLYADVEPLHYGTVVPYDLGGNDPIHGISVYPREAPRPHWHFITYGFTDLFGKPTADRADPHDSGHGFELTLRLARRFEDTQPPSWALNFLQNLGRYVFGTGNSFAAGHKMGLNGPIALDHDTRITAICFADDPELGELSSELGKARFVQIVGITDDEYRLIQEWSTTGLVEILAQHLPLLVTDLARGSVLDDPATAAVIRDRVDREGSSEELTFAGELSVTAEAGQLRVELGALYAATLPRAMRGRIRHGRRYELRGKAAALQLEPSETLGYRFEGNDLVLELTHALASEIEAALGGELAGTYRFAAWPQLTIVVTPSIIRGQDGGATEVRGVADPREAERILAQDSARRAGLASTGADDDGGGDDDGEAADDADLAPDLAQLAAALAMTRRALRLAPGDEDVQLAHAMLLLDAERAGDPAMSDELLALLAVSLPQVRVNVAVRMARTDHPRFGEAVERVLAEAQPAQPALPVGGAAGSSVGNRIPIGAFGELTPELFGELGEAILERSPRHIGRLVPALPDDAKLLSELAQNALEADQRDAALALYDRVLALAVPHDGEDRLIYLRALNNACVQAHAAGAFEAAARLADRAQPVAHDNPQLYHSAACAYAAIHDYGRAFEQVKLAIEHGYEHAARIETDTDLGPVLDWPELKALFRDWHARREGN